MERVRQVLEVVLFGLEDVRLHQREREHLARGERAHQRLLHLQRSDAKSSLGDAESSLGDAESSLGDAKSSLGDATSSTHTLQRQIRAPG